MRTVAIVTLSITVLLSFTACDDGTGAETTLVGYEPLSWGEIKLLFEEE